MRFVRGLMSYSRVQHSAVWTLLVYTRAHSYIHTHTQEIQERRLIRAPHERYKDLFEDSNIVAKHDFWERERDQQRRHPLHNGVNLRDLCTRSDELANPGASSPLYARAVSNKWARGHDRPEHHSTDSRERVIILILPTLLFLESNLHLDMTYLKTNFKN